MGSKLQKSSDTKLISLNHRYVVYILIIIAVMALAFFENSRGIEKSILLVEPGENVQDESTGILVGTNNSNLKYAITSYDAVSGVTDTTSQLLTGILPAEEDKDPREVRLQVVYADKEKNLAILQLGKKTKKNSFLTFRAEDETPLRQDENLYLLKQTGGTGEFTSDYNKVPINYNALFPSQSENANSASSNNLKVSGIVPVLDENEYMVGVLTGGEKNIFIPAEEIGNLLTSASIEVFYVGQQKGQFFLSGLAAVGLIMLSITATALKRKKIRDREALRN